ncbi:alpha/beta hydrolase-fold protein [soil metagenome]
MKEAFHWRSDRLAQHVTVVRWGYYGTPVLIFPTAGGDAEEIERFHLIGALGSLLEEGRVKVYSVDSTAGRAWLTGVESPEYCSRLQNAFDGFIYREVLPMIRSDCRSPDIEVITAGASIGAFNAVASVCRHPDAFRIAIGMSGTFDLSKYLQGRFTENFYFSSPLHFLPQLEGPQLEMLRRRFVLIPTGEGRWEDVGESWRMAKVLGDKGVPNRVDPWGPQWDHNWVTWREMLPTYLNELA